jgi:hypothetical protein
MDIFLLCVYRRIMPPYMGKCGVCEFYQPKKVSATRGQVTEVGMPYRIGGKWGYVRLTDIV